MTYVFIGPPACGKSTQGELLQKVTGMRFVSIGKALRAQAEHDTDYAKHLAKGDLFPTDMLQQLFSKLHSETQDNLIMDGGMRREDQVNTLVDLWGRDKLAVILFDAPDAVLEARAHGRKEVRTDSSDKTLAHRLEQYREALPSILDRIHHFNLPVITIDASPSIDAIHHEIMTKLKNYELPTKN